MPSPSSPAHHCLKYSKITSDKQGSSIKSMGFRIFLKALSEKESEDQGWSLGRNHEAARQTSHATWEVGAEPIVLQSKRLSCTTWLIANAKQKNCVYFSSSLNTMFTRGTSMDSCILKCLPLIHTTCLKCAMKLMILLNPGQIGDLV